MRSTLDMLHALRDIDDSRLNAQHQLVLAMMLAFREGDSAQVHPERRGASAPSVRLLVRSTRLSERTVQRTRADLCSWGYLSVRVEGTPKTAPVFELHLPERGASTVPPRDAPETPLDVRGVSETPQGRTTDTPGVPAVPPRGVSVAPFADLSADQIADQIADQHPSDKPTASLFGDDLGKEEPKTKSRGGKAAEGIFAAYVKARKEWKPTTRVDTLVLSDKARKAISARLREGHTVETLVLAARGIFLDPWEGRSNHIDLEIAMRSDNVVKFAEFAREADEREARWGKVDNRSPHRPKKRAAAVLEELPIEPLRVRTPEEIEADNALISELLGSTLVPAGDTACESFRPARVAWQANEAPKKPEMTEDDYRRRRDEQVAKFREWAATHDVESTAKEATG